MEASPAFHPLLSFALILAFSILCDSAPDYGFTLELIHRDSPRSPYYNRAETPYQRAANAIRRSISRADQDTPSGVVVSDNSDYLMNISLGNPPVTIVGLVDTGSDLIWTQCKPCTHCFKQATPVFDPRASSTYKDISCQTLKCRAFGQTSCSGRAGLCEYFYSYHDNSSTMGNLATETFTLGSSSGRPVSIHEVVFGCGHNNSGKFDDSTNGIIGFGGGDASLTSQLGEAAGGKFSYCLVPYWSDHKVSSKLNFGANAVVSGPGVVSTPLVQKDHYYLTLEAVSVGKTRIEFTSNDSFAASAGQGNIIIDSGTAITRLPLHFYTKIEAAMVESVKLPRTGDPSQFLSLCFEAEKDVELGIPTVTFHFKGADVGLPSENTFLRVADNITCLAMKPDTDTIYGNLAQMNYLIGYDTQNMKLSFKPVDCTSN
ncbi:Peptidase A1 domain-containing protein [Psidium guajava]|nr:Peptidase A1 domain-containing protein [Psidium guajava]